MSVDKIKVGSEYNCDIFKPCEHKVDFTMEEMQCTLITTIPIDLENPVFKGWKVIALPPIPDLNGQVALKCTWLRMKFSRPLRAAQ